MPGFSAKPKAQLRSYQYPSPPCRMKVEKGYSPFSVFKHLHFLQFVHEKTRPFKNADRYLFSHTTCVPVTVVNAGSYFLKLLQALRIVFLISPAIQNADILPPSRWKALGFSHSLLHHRQFSCWGLHKSLRILN